MSQEAYPKMITDLPKADILFEGVEGWLLQAKEMQVLFFQIQKPGTVPEHSHGAQWGIVVQGELTLVIGGVQGVYKRGDSYYIPAGSPHSAIFNSPCKVIDFFADVDRYRPK
jgi:quercetin dioxygenase-like cupin family protein